MENNSLNNFQGTDRELSTSLFKLPWSKNNNPNGWIEVTSYCQLECPGCYRGLDQPDPIREHESLDTLKKGVDAMVAYRNVECLSIAGGEPLLYPRLEEFLVYIHSKGCYPLIFTNGLALTEKKCARLNALGVGIITFVVHVGDYQGRGDEETVKATLLRRISCYENLRVSFTRIIDSANARRLPEYLQFDLRNNRNLAFQLFTLKKNLANDQASGVELTCTDVVRQIRREMPFEPCAYLPTIHDPHRIGWLLSFPVYFRGKVIGFFDAEIVKFFVDSYYRLHGKYAYIQKATELDFSLMKGLLQFRRMQEIYRNYQEELKRSPDGPVNPTFHLILFVKPPERSPEKLLEASGAWNLCDGCPDAMFHENKLVPSCLLERIKAGQNIVVE